MGIDLAGFRFLRYALAGQALGDTLTLGRQEVHISKPILRRECGVSISEDPFCEWLLTSVFKASSVASMDNSTYENATILHDSNFAVPQDLENRFDAVLDFGTLEHIFNFPQAIRNCISMCKKDGLILHCIPANNQCGHGFWQVSPELFFSLYSEENGFRETEVFLVSPTRPAEFYRVRKPVNGLRANVRSKSALMVAVRTRKDRDKIETLSVQQSDYVTAWSDAKHTQHAIASSNIFKTWLGQFPDLYEALHSVKARLQMGTSYPGFHARNPWLERVDITSDNSGSRA